MSEICDRGKDAFLCIPIAYVDDLPLTTDAFRLLIHLYRLAGSKGYVDGATYKQMGEACYKATYPKTTIRALHRRAMTTMKELVDIGLVRVEATTTLEGGQGANRYVLIQFVNQQP